MPRPVEPIVSPGTPTPDPRVGLKAGRWDAGQAAWNMRLISTTPPAGKTLGATHSDLAFAGKYAIQGNYNGFELYDISGLGRGRGCGMARPLLVAVLLDPPRDLFAIHGLGLVLHDGMPETLRPLGDIGV
jgi:hypothetical protein